MACYLGKIRSELTQCAICLGEFNDPRCLPCLHSFCLDCLTSNISVTMPTKDSVQNSFPCPTCRKQTKLPADGVTGLVRDFKSNKIKDLLTKLDKTKGQHICDLCPGRNNQSTAFCCDCRKHMCSVCFATHQNQSVLTQHFIIPISPVKQKPFKACLDHKGEYVTYFCDTCELEICIVCIFDKHSSHTIVGLEETSMARRQNLKDHVHKVDSFISQTRQSLYRLTQTASKIQTMYEEIKFQVKKNSSKMIQKIVSNESKVLLDVDDIYNRKKEDIQQAKVDLQLYLGQLERCKAQTETFLLGSDSMHMQEAYPQLLTSMENLASSYNTEEYKRHIQSFVTYIPGSVISFGRLDVVPLKSSMETHKVQALKGDNSFDAFHMGGNSTESPVFKTSQAPSRTEKEHQQDKMLFPPQRKYHNIDGSGSEKEFTQKYATMPASKTSETLEEHTSLKQNWTQSKRTSPAAARQSQSKQQHGHHSSFSPATVCPVSVCARLVCQVGGYGRGQGQLSLPNSVCFNNRLELVVAEIGNKRLQVFNIEGFSVRTIAEGSLVPRCVTATKTSQLACTDELTKSIKIVQEDGRILSSISSSSVSFPCSLDTTIEGYFAVTDMIFESISILNEQGDLVTQFGNCGNSNNGLLENPSCIHVNAYDTILVSDAGNHDIKLYDKFGNFLYKFGCYGTGPGCLRNPQGITSTTDIVFVADSGNDRVVMFSHLGEYLGCLLTEDYGIKHPAGLAYDTGTGLLAVALPEIHEVRVYQVSQTVSATQALLTAD